MIPGEYILKDGEIILNENSEGLTLLVANAGDRPVQVGSHIISLKPMRLSSLTGKRHMACGLILQRALPSGSSLVKPARCAGADKRRATGLRVQSENHGRARLMPARISRTTYAAMYGPTTGDRVRLADTELFIEVEKDLTTYGEESSSAAARSSATAWVSHRSRAPTVPWTRS